MEISRGYRRHGIRSMKLLVTFCPKSRRRKDGCFLLSFHLVFFVLFGVEHMSMGKVIYRNNLLQACLEVYLLGVSQSL